MNKLVLIFLAFFLALAAAARSRECDAVSCPIGTKCVETPQKCLGTPCPQYTCKAIRNNPCKSRTCPRGELCLPEPKFCIRAPCPQYSCLTPEDYICATAECPEGTTCKAQANVCKKSPCPQYVCEVDHCAGNTCDEETEICLASPRMCIRAPCPQYTCKDLSYCAMKCSMDYIPVCGSDGNTYTNACILQSTSCNTRTLITMIHEGECGNPVEPTADPCDRMCPMVYQPVCGTDGQTYGNQCLLGVASCRDDSVAFAHEGECETVNPTEPNPCDRMCPMVYQPVCGTDGQTYGNQCLLGVASCRDDSIAFAYEGECEKNCDNKRCPMVYQPVCGTNGVTYSNDCLLSIAACKDDSIAVAYEGECKSDCEDKICPMVYQPVCGSNGITYGNQCMLNGAACKDDSITMAYEGECVKNCDIACPRHWAPVCGTNGVTYGNACMLNAAACKDDSILLAHEGECVKNCETGCTKIYDPVCGTDGVTYGNECMLNVAICKDDSIALAHKGECDPVHPCALVDCGPTKICLADPKECITTPCDQFVCIDASLCGRMCPMIYAPVCGTDGNTYSNACMLQNASCDQVKVISVAHNGECGSNPEY